MKTTKTSLFWRIGGPLLVLALIAGGVAAGARWHVAFERWFKGEQPEEVATGPANGARKQLWTCGMHPQVLQDKPGQCPICGMQLTPLVLGGDEAQAAKGDRKIKYWWDPMMNPPFISDAPGKSPMGMDLIPVYEDEVMAGPRITIDPVIVQNMGVRVTPVRRGTLSKEIRAVGYLAEAQPNIFDLNLRVSGWIEELHADTEGMHVRKGDPLFELYSPDVLVAVKELQITRRRREPSGDLPAAQAPLFEDTVYEASRRKLRLWGLSDEQITGLAAMDGVPRTVTFFSPMTGDVTEKLVVEGAAVKAGDRVLRVVDHSTLWLDAQLYEQHLPLITMGQEATATIEAMPGRVFHGEVIFIHPRVDPMTRTATVRLTLPNPELTLRPGMFATAVFTAERAGESVLVPREAVIDTGDRKVAFLALSEGRFEPRRVETGLSGSDGMIQILAGLAPGEVVVTSGQFLLDAESRMKEAIQKHLEAGLLKSGRPATAPAEMPPTRPSPAEAPAPAATQPTALPGEVIAWTPELDRVFKEYLSIAEALGAPQKTDSPIDATRLVSAAESLKKSAGDPAPNVIRDVSDAASAMKGQPLAEQRNRFKPLSDAVIALAQARPPSQAVAKRLFVLHCPMVDASWLQTRDQVANPYYATEMKACGEVKRVVEAAKP